MYYLLFTCYLLLACYIVTRSGFIKKTRLTATTILFLFIIKVAAGVFLGWMSQRFYPQGNDYWGLNQNGWNEYTMMTTDPKRFLTDIFQSNYGDDYGGFFRGFGSFWNDLKNTLIGKLLAICNIFSRGNYYINSLFLNLGGFFGHVALFRVFSHIYDNRCKWALIIGCFLLPSTLYFSSGIHKDLVVFCMLGLYSYALYFSFAERSTLKRTLLLGVSLIALLFIRNFVAIAILPASLAFIISIKKKWYSGRVFACLYISGIMLLGFIQFIKPSFKPLSIVSQRQEEFLALPYASSQLDKHILKPDVNSLLRNAPQALDHGILQPHIWNIPTRFLVPLAIELLFYQLLFIGMLLFYRPRPPFNPFTLYGICLAVTMLIFTGYVVPNIGAIVRYRSLYLPFLITPILYQFFNRVKQDRKQINF